MHSPSRNSHLFTGVFPSYFYSLFQLQQGAWSHRRGSFNSFLIAHWGEKKSFSTRSQKSGDVSLGVTLDECDRKCQQCRRTQQEIQSKSFIQPFSGAHDLKWRFGRFEASRPGRGSAEGSGENRCRSRKYLTSVYLPVQQESKQSITCREAQSEADTLSLYIPPLWTATP